MPVFTLSRLTNHPKVHYSQYIVTEDKPSEDATSPDSQPLNPEQPEAS